MKIQECPKCLQKRKKSSPVSLKARYVWWHVLGHGYMCWKCYDKLEKEKVKKEKVKKEKKGKGMKNDKNK